MKKPLIISYQQGKVASSSITASITDCIQTHSWTPEEPIKYFSSRYTGSIPGRLVQTFRWKFTHKRLQGLLNKALRTDQPVKLLIGVREPISRNISGYFQTLTHRETHTSLEQQINRFYAHCTHLAPIYWFENELKEHFKINIYDYPFNKTAGYSVYKIGQIEVFLYKFESIRDLEPAVAEFLDLHEFKLSKSNDANDKWSSELYNKFCKEITLPTEYIHLMYNNHYAKHFYSEAEINGFINKWSTQA